VFATGGEDDSFQLHPNFDFLGGGLSRSGIVLGITTECFPSFSSFSLRFTSEPKTEGETDDRVVYRGVGRELQASLISLSSKSWQSWMILSRLSDQTIKTRSSRYFTRLGSSKSNYFKFCAHNESTTLFLICTGKMAHRMKDLNSSVGIDMNGRGIVITATIKSVCSNKTKQIIHMVDRAACTLALLILTATTGLRDLTAASNGARYWFS
jgi:hypothetical protein